MGRRKPISSSKPLQENWRGLGRRRRETQASEAVCYIFL
jgi:hypothetical protein